MPASLLKSELVSQPKEAILLQTVRLLGLQLLEESGNCCLVFNHLVDPASSCMLVSKIKPCMSKYKPLYGETANGSLKQL